MKVNTQIFNFFELQRISIPILILHSIDDLYKANSSKSRAVDITSQVDTKLKRICADVEQMDEETIRIHQATITLFIDSMMTSKKPLVKCLPEDDRQFMLTPEGKKELVNWANTLSDFTAALKERTSK